MHLRTLGDIRPRSGYTDAHRDACDEEAAQQHGEVHAEHHHQHAQHIDQQVVGEDELTSEPIGQETTDDGTDGGTQCVLSQPRCISLSPK